MWAYLGGYSSWHGDFWFLVLSRTPASQRHVKFENPFSRQWLRSRRPSATHTSGLGLLAAVAAGPAGAVRSALPTKLAADSYTTSSRQASAFKTPITATHTFALALAAVAASAGDGDVGPFGGGGGGDHQGVGDRDSEVKMVVEGGGRWWKRWWRRC